VEVGVRRETLYRNLAASLRLGAEPAEAAAYLWRGSSAVAAGLEGRLAEGADLAHALQEVFPATFPSGELAVIAAADGAGDDGDGATLIATLEALAENAERTRQTLGRVGFTLCYAIAVLCALCAAALLASEIVLPPLASAAQTVTRSEAAGLERAIGAARRLPVAVGGGVLLGAGVVAVARFALPRAGGVPLLPRRLRAALSGLLPGTAAMVTVIRLTLRAGGDFGEALHLTAGAGLLPAGDVAQELRRRGATGEAIAPVMHAGGLLPTELAARLDAAERAGDLEIALEAVARALDGRRAAALESAPRIVAAVTTVALGGALLWFALVVVVPALTAFAGGG
jgi:type II secretory pathway component PulF